MKEKVVSTDTVFKGRFLKVHRDEVILPDGKQSYREYIVHPGAAMVIPVLDSETILMIKQYRHAVKETMWEFPAGKKDAGEDSLTTAKRELLEETGCQSEDIRYLTSIHPVIGYADEKIDIFIATQILRGPSKLDEGEFLTVHEVKIKEAFQMLHRGEITDVKTQVGLFWLEKVMLNGW